MPPPRHRWFAATYDFFMRLDPGLMPDLRRFAAGGASGRVLEIGAGTGLNLEFYNWSRIESLDLAEPDPFMLKRARQKVEGLAPDLKQRVTLHEAPAEALSFAAASFDTVVCTLVLCTVTDPIRCIAEIQRVLKPEGTLRLVEHVGGRGRLASVQRVVQPAWAWAAAGCHLNRATEAHLLDAGFRLENIEHFKLGPLLPGFLAIAM